MRNAECGIKKASPIFGEDAPFFERKRQCEDLSCLEGIAAGVLAGGRFAVTYANLTGGAHIVRSVVNAVTYIARYAKLSFTFTV